MNFLFVFVDVGPRAPWVTNIRVDYLHGIQQAIRHLAALRHESIGFICGPTELPSARARLEAFEQSMAGVGLPVRPEYIVQGEHKLEGEKLAFSQLSRLHDRPTALLCSNDMTAIGVIRQAYEQGLSVPVDLSVVGFDDTRLADYIVPPLTTIQMSQKDLAQIAFLALLQECRRQGTNRRRHGIPANYAFRLTAVHGLSAKSRTLATKNNSAAACRASGRLPRDGREKNAARLTATLDSGSIRGCANILSSASSV